LRDDDFEVVLVSPPGPYTSVFDEQKFRWLPWDVGRQSLAPWQEIPAIIALSRIYRKEQPDLIHHHTIKPVLYGSIVGRALRLNNIVNSITGRGYVFLSRSRKATIMRLGATSLYHLAFGNPNYLAIFENQDDRQYFIDKGFVSADNACWVAGLGVDVERFKPSIESPGIPVVLHSSRMLWDKGVGVLVEAARLLHQRSQVRIVLVGESDPGNPGSIETDQLQAWAQEGLIEWWGWQHDMSSVYQKCHIVTLPSMYGEGVPLALMEAAACGKPIVTTDMPGCREIALHGYNGLVVPPNDPSALADAIHTLIIDPELRGRMGANGRQLVLEKFTVEQVNAATLAVYQRVLEHSKNPLKERNRH
jgi:glycosyltransferase involved in cell wall biosynthesis